jgi:hypothetical protein
MKSSISEILVQRIPPTSASAQRQKHEESAENEANTP